MNVGNNEPFSVPAEFPLRIGLRGLESRTRVRVQPVLTSESTSCPGTRVQTRNPFRRLSQSADRTAEPTGQKQPGNVYKSNSFP